MGQNHRLFFQIGHDSPQFTMIHHNLPWFTMICYYSPWCTMHHESVSFQSNFILFSMKSCRICNDLPWFIMIRDDLRIIRIYHYSQWFAKINLNLPWLWFAMIHHGSPTCKFLRQFYCVVWKDSCCFAPVCHDLPQFTMFDMNHDDSPRFTMICEYV